MPKLAHPNLRGETNRLRCVATVDARSKEILKLWHYGPVLSLGDLFDRMTRFCVAKKFTPAKSKNWNEQ